MTSRQGENEREVTVIAVVSTAAAALAASALLVRYSYWKRNRSSSATKKPFDELPMPPNPHWLQGHRVFMKGDFRQYFRTLFLDNVDENGRLGLWVFTEPCLLVSHWEDVRTILQHEYKRRRIPAMRKHVTMFLGSRNLGILEGREWKHNRAAILRSFSRAKSEKAAATIVEVADTFVASLQKKIADNQSRNGGTCGMEVKVDELMKMLTFDIFGRVAFSQDLECTKRLTPSPLARAFDFLGEELTRRSKSPFSPSNLYYWIPTANNRRHKRERTVLRTFLHEAISKRISSENQPDDMLSAMLAALKDDADPLMEETLQDNLLTLLFAGYDTTSITLSYAIALVSQHPEVEKEMLLEIESATSQSLSDLDELTYCQAVVFETLRLFPPGVATNRFLDKPVQLKGGFLVHANTFVLIPIWLTQNMERHFPQPQAFRPDRWVRRTKGKEKSRWVDRSDDEEGEVLESGGIPAGNRRAFFAFSGGGRSCAGQNLARQESTIALAKLTQSLRFRLKKGYELKPVRVGIVQYPQDGLPMVVQAR